MTLYLVSRSYIHKVSLHSIFRHFISDILQAITDLNSTWVILYSILKRYQRTKHSTTNTGYLIWLYKIFSSPSKKIMQIAIMIIVQIIDYSTHDLPATILLRQAFCSFHTACLFANSLFNLLWPMLYEFIHIQMKTEKSKYMTVKCLLECRSPSRYINK